MIIKDKTFLHSIEEDGDKLKFNHMQDVDPVMEEVQAIKMFSDNGWTKERNFRQIGHIPEGHEWWLRKHKPEIFKDMKALKRWLMSEEGRPWRTVTAMDTGRSGKAIVK